MKKIILIIILLVSGYIYADHGGKPTEEFVVKGRIKNDLRLTLDSLKNYQEKFIGDIILTNQRGEAKDTVKNLKGILFKDILKQIELLADRPKLYNEFYFTCIASDNYKVVYSWNEIFNTEVGNNIYIVTERAGEKGREITSRILMVSKSDVHKGRRYVENLSEIIVNRVE